MGWRADEAYEQAQREDYRRWRQSLTWPDYLRFRLSRFGPFLAGAGAAGLIAWLLLG